MAYLQLVSILEQLPESDHQIAQIDKIKQEIDTLNFFGNKAKICDYLLFSIVEVHLE